MFFMWEVDGSNLGRENLSLLRSFSINVHKINRNYPYNTHRSLILLNLSLEMFLLI